MPTNTLYTAYSGYANATVTVTTTAELNAALANLTGSGGGTILLDANGGPFNISGNGVGDVNNPILIKALDPTNPPLVQNIYLINSSYIAMTDLKVDSTGTGSTVHDLRISGSDNIEFVGNTMTSNANGYLDGSASVTKGASASLIRDSSDIVFNNNILSNYGAGTTFLEVNGLDYSNNDISGFQYDGFAGGGLQNVTITNNNMHDFWGSVQTINHSDYIMIWGTNAQTVTSNIDISNNIIDTGSLASYQGIFIGNNELGNGGPSGQYFQDIQVYDNVVHTSMWHGIFVGQTQNLEIYNNAVLFNDMSFTKTDPTSAWAQAQPWIMAANSPNAQVYGNISGRVDVNGVRDYSNNNQLLDYNDPATGQYVDNFVANLTWGAGTTGGGSGSTSSGTGTTSGSTDTSGTDTTTTDTTTDATGTQADTTGTQTDTAGTQTDTAGTQSDTEGSDTDTFGNSDTTTTDGGGTGGNGNGKSQGNSNKEIYDKSVETLLDKFTGNEAGKDTTTNSTNGQQTPTLQDLVLMFETGDTPTDTIAPDEGETTDNTLLELA